MQTPAFGTLTIMTHKPQTFLPQHLTHLPLNPPRNANTPKRPIASLDAVESAATSFFKKFFSVRSFGLHEVRDRGEGLEFLSGAFAGRC